MWCEVTPLHQIKLGNDVGDYEDAFAFGPLAPSANGDGNGNGNGRVATVVGGERGQRIYIAVADGATESSFAGMWATMLVRAYRKGEMQSVEALRTRVDALTHRWQRSLTFRKLPWYAEEKARRGAFATLLGLTITPSQTPNSGSWCAVAVGDSCLFHLRDEALVESFPICDSSEFGHSPLLLSSDAAKNVRVWDDLDGHSGEWERGDVFLLATDALAQWLLVQHERGHQPWQEIIRIASSAHAPDTFAAWIAECRANWNMRNDDVTCVVVRLPGC